MTDQEFIEIKESMIEEWKQVIVKGEKLNYDISNTGKLRNHTTHFMHKPSRTSGMKNCYEFVQLKDNNGKVINTSIHRLVG